MTSARLALSAAFLVCAAVPAVADQGALPIRPGDTVSGTLRKCGERHSLEVQLLKREVLRMHVAPEGHGSVHVRVFDPEGLDVSDKARVRLVGNSVRLGPFRSRVSGTYNVEIATFSAHGTNYEATSRVRRTRSRSVSVGGRRRARAFPVAAGSRVQVRVRRGDPELTLALPDGSAQVLGADDARRAALLGGGLAAPSSGVYRLTLADRKSRVRVIVTPPEAVSRDVTFPEMPEGAVGTASWYWSQSWVPTTRVESPDPVFEGEAPTHVIERHDTSTPTAPTPWTETRLSERADPAASSVRGEPTKWSLPSGLVDESTWQGAFTAVGMPLCGFPPIQDALRAEPVAAAGGPAYVCTAEREPFGEVTYRVQFLVDGIPTVAPMALTGRVTVQWTATSAQPHHRGAWVLTLDPSHDLTVLDGEETWTDSSLRTVRSSADGFTVSARRGWPTGELRLSYAAAYGAAGASRVERFDGTDTVQVDVRDGFTERAATLSMTR